MQTSLSSFSDRLTLLFPLLLIAATVGLLLAFHGSGPGPAKINFEEKELALALAREPGVVLRAFGAKWLHDKLRQDPAALPLGAEFKLGHWVPLLPLLTWGSPSLPRLPGAEQFERKITITPQPTCDSATNTALLVTVAVRLRSADADADSDVPPMITEETLLSEDE